MSSRRTSRTGTIYLLHFDRPLHHARHYLGWTENLDERLAAHESGSGACILAACRASGIGWRLARTWTGTRHEERRLKRCKMAPRYCPTCREERRAWKSQRAS
jgi:predicted GIY-YIG superfamily endonuclease